MATSEELVKRMEELMRKDITLSPFQAMKSAREELGVDQTIGLAALSEYHQRVVAREKAKQEKIEQSDERHAPWDIREGRQKII